MNPRWVVIYSTDGGEPLCAPFEEERDARAFYDRLAVQWSDALLCRVVRNAGLMRSEQSEET